MHASTHEIERESTVFLPPEMLHISDTPSTDRARHRGRFQEFRKLHSGKDEIENSIRPF